MADPLVLKFDVETNRAKQGMADLAGSIADNMARVATSMTGGASKVSTMGGALENLVGNARRASLAIGTDLLKVANDTSAAATKTNANLQDVAVAFTKAAATSNTASTAISTGWATGTTALSTTLQQVPALGTAVEIFVAYKVAILGVAAAFALFEKAASLAADQIKKLQDIQKGSEAAGIGSAFYQDQIRDLQRFGMTAEEAAKSLIKTREALSGSVGETGGLQEAGIFKTLGELRDTGFTQLNEPLNRLLGAAPNDIETRTKAARDAMKALHDAAAETGNVNLEALADQIGKALGYSKDATEEVKKVGDSARQAGDNFEDGLVRQSKELDQKIADIHAKLSQDLQPIMTDLARLGLAFKDAWQGSLGLIESAIGAIGRAYGRMKQLADERDRLGEGAELYIPGAKQSFRTPAARRGIAGRLAPESTQDLAEGTGDAQAQASLADRAALAGLPEHPPSPIARPADLGKKAAAESTDEVDTYIKSLQKAVEVLKAENDTFGQSNTLKAEAVDLERALAAARTRGTPLTDKEREAVKKLADEEGAAKDRAEELRRAQEAMNEQAQFLGNQLISAFDKIGESGTRATDVIKDMVKALIRAVEQALLLGSGPLANLFGTQGKQGQTGGLSGLAVGGLTRAFGGGGGGATDFEGGAGDIISEIDSEGGLAGHGRFRKYVPRSAFIGAPQFATGGGIPAILHPGEVVLNAAQQKNVASRMGGPRINVTHSPVINGTGLSKEEVFSLMQRNNKDFARQIGPIFSDWQRRFG